MRLSLFTTALLPLAALATPLLSVRDAPSIVASINTITARISTLNASLNTFQKGDLDGLFKVLKIQQQTTDLGNAIKSATRTARASKKLTEAGSGTVANAVLTLQPKIFSLLDNIVAKKPAFDGLLIGLVSVSQTVRKSLVEQKADSAAFGNAVTAKLTPTFAAFAPTIIAQINDAFDKAIKVYSQKGGVISLPPLKE